MNCKIKMPKIYENSNKIDETKIFSTAKNMTWKL